MIFHELTRLQKNYQRAITAAENDQHGDKWDDLAMARLIFVNFTMESFPDFEQECIERYLDKLQGI